MNSQISDFGFSIDTRTTERLPDYVELPDDTYFLVITEAERKVSTKNPNNWFMRVTFEITAGKFKGRKHREMYNTGHTDNEIRARAMSDIVKIADAVGFVGQLSGFGPLFGKVFAAEIKQRKEKDKDKDGNEVAVMRARINKVMPASAVQASVGTAAPAAAPLPAGFGATLAQPAAQAQQAPAAAAGLPWNVAGGEAQSQG